MHSLFFTIIVLIIENLNSLKCTINDTLVLTHVIFRHGDRTPSASCLWKTNKFYNESFYEPFGYGQLTNKGKRTSYNLGVKLNKRYNKFLKQWSTKIADTFSTDYDRTKMSASLVLGGLFPPKEPVLWNNNVLWQPIPYSYKPVPLDKELSSWACPRTVPLIYSNANNMKKLQSYVGLIKILQENTGDRTIDYISALDLYFGMLIQEELGFPLDNWTKLIYPEPFRSFVIDFYHIETSTQELKTVLVGYLIKKILNDSINKIEGTSEQQIYLYSGHEVNVATILTSLKLIDVKDIPNYGSHVIFELHKINGVYGIKIFFENFQNNEPNLLVMPGCKTFCSLDDFVKLTANIIPTGDVECFGN